MKTKRNKMPKNKRKHSKSKKKWVTAVDAAQNALKRTGSLSKARSALRVQAFNNARKLFGSVGERR
jgi:hypothetical protein